MIEANHKKIKNLLSQHIPNVQWEEYVSMSSKTYMKIGGPAEFFGSINTSEELQLLRKLAYENNFSVRIIGGGSNILVSDLGISGVVVIFSGSRLDFDEATRIDANGNQVTQTHTTVIAESGIKMSQLVAKTVENGLTGLEYFLGVPGTLGGATYNNAHYMEHLISEYIHEVEAIDAKGTVIRYPIEACQFAYEKSRFQKSNEVILRVMFQLPKGSKIKSNELIAEAIRYRAATQPLGIPSSGCIFQNHPNSDHLRKLFPKFANAMFVPAGYIIDQAGLKGLQYGGVKVSDKHAAWLLNENGGSAKDVRTIIKIIKETVQKKYDILLHEEIFYVGDEQKDGEQGTTV